MGPVSIADEEINQHIVNKVLHIQQFQQGLVVGFVCKVQSGGVDKGQIVALATRFLSRAGIDINNIVLTVFEAVIIL